MRARLGLGDPSSGASHVFFAGQSLNDDIYHAVVVRRRGGKVEVAVDDDETVVGEWRESPRVKFARWWIIELRQAVEDAASWLL